MNFIKYCYNNLKALFQYKEKNTHLLKYKMVFVKCFDISLDEVDESLCRNGIIQWDSIGHGDLILSIENEFKIHLLPEDAMAFDSYQHGISILRKYGINI